MGRNPSDDEFDSFDWGDEPEDEKNWYASGDTVSRGYSPSRSRRNRQRSRRQSSSSSLKRVFI